MRRKPVWPYTLFVFLFLSLQGLTLAAAQANSEFRLEGPSQTAEGYFQLRVEGLDDEVRFIVQQSSTEDFSDIDAEFEPLGSFRQLSLSGFGDGTYYFRAVADDTYSNVHALEVRHYPLWQALSLFCVGFIIFFVLLVTIVRYHRSQASQGA